MDVKQAKALIKKYKFRWRFDRMTKEMYIECVCKHNANCPVTGKMVVVNRNELSKRALKRLPDCCVKYNMVQAPLLWFRETITFEDPIDGKSMPTISIPKQYTDKAVNCPYCTTAFEVQCCVESAPLWLRIYAKLVGA